MKLATLILMTTMLHVSAATMAQRLTLKKRNVPMSEIFKEIRKQTGYTVLLAADQLDVSKRMDVDFRQSPLDEVLQRILPKQAYRYQVEDNNILIEKKEEKGIFEKISEYLAAIEVKGKIVGQDGLPLPGASVKVKGTNKSTVTDREGFFTLNGVAENAIIEITYMGFVAREVSAVVNLGTITLVLSDSKLDEVQVIAYGTTTQRLSVGNVATVSAKEIERQPVNNVLNALQGRVPGLFITQSNGFAGGGVTVRVQGQNSLTNGNDPFIVIDGVPYPSQSMQNDGAQLGTSNGPPMSGPGNPLAFINPSDIESISVLKDADATAIYGSRAANGAILITTKRGKVGDMNVSLNVQQGIGKVARRLDLMDTRQYLQMRKEAFTNDNLPIPSILNDPNDRNFDINGHWDQNRYTDWQQELIGGTADYTDVSANVSGGSQEIQYLVGGTYHRETTVFPGDFSDVKASLNFRLNSNSKNQRLKMAFGGKYLRDVNKLPVADLTNRIFTAPNAPALYGADGLLNWAPNSLGAASWQNPLADLNNGYKAITGNLILDGSLDYSIIDGLNLKLSFGFNDFRSREITTSPLAALAPEERPTGYRSAVFGSGDRTFWNLEPQLNYSRKLGPGQLSVLAGASAQRADADNSSIFAGGQNSDAVLENIKAASNFFVNRTMVSTYKYFGYFARATYSINEKYLVSLNGRRDGSSRFGSRNKFNNLGSVGAGWVFSKEKFFSERLKMLSFGKIRANYGETGSDQIMDYVYLNNYFTMTSGVPYQGAAGLYPSAHANPYIQWEENRKLNVGLDLGFFADRLLLNIDHNRNRSSSQLITSSLSAITGFGNVTENFPALIQNTGWEFTLNTVNINSDTFRWSTNFNLTIPKNKLIEFPGIEKTIYFGNLVIGKSTQSRMVYHMIGLDPASGRYQFANAAGTAVEVPDLSSDRTVLVDLAPKYYGGLGNTFSYKGFQLDFLFQFTKRIAQNYDFGPGYPGIDMTNSIAALTDRWKAAGDIAKYPMASTDYDRVWPYYDVMDSDAGFSDASFIRLKNASLSWSLPKRLLDRLRLKKFSVYIQGQNLWTITSYSGMDPETLGSNSLPVLRTITTGFQINL